MINSIHLDKNNFLTHLQARKKPIDRDSDNADDPNSETLFDDELLNVDLLGETSIDKSIALAVKQLLDEGPAEPELSPAEVFNNLYQDIKDRKHDNGTNGTVPTSEEMLSKLFTDTPANDPFDDKKVMFKLRNFLDPEDFTALFNDPNVGDWL
eukprot:CAMPEP_0174983284 /NCGR_PEP_ID=MMETSP0004_2-20121128/17040_1 /TAXON_ID=420556 /ORGANISM="Ochromonas sp., Strain CCMP1393" /LENGTH=152 /DNA_ID=CAMNT_0016235483 /DNA_START=186 /DNA_END=644 /DNA_ORIENTATION=+